MVEEVDRFLFLTVAARDSAELTGVNILWKDHPSLMGIFGVL